MNKVKKAFIDFMYWYPTRIAVGCIVLAFIYIPYIPFIAVKLVVFVYEALVIIPYNSFIEGYRLGNGEYLRHVKKSFKHALNTGYSW